MVILTWGSPHPHFYNSVCWFLGGVARRSDGRRCQAALSGGAGSGRGGGGTEVATGLAKETRRRRFGPGLSVERQDCWREPDNGWRPTDLAAIGGRPLRGSSAACVSSGVWQGFRR